MPLKMTRTHTLVYIPAALLLAGAVLAAALPRGGPRGFSDAGEFRDWAKAHGLHVFPEGVRGFGVVVSGRHTAGRLQAIELGLSPARVDHSWAGVVRAVGVSDLADPPAIYTRRWGGILVGGDPELLDRLEALR